MRAWERNETWKRQNPGALIAYWHGTNHSKTQ